MVQRELSFAIVDEVDSILVDEARTPLIISGKGDKSSELYERVDRFVRTLTGGFDDEGSKGEEDKESKKKRKKRKRSRRRKKNPSTATTTTSPRAPSTAIGITSSTARSAASRSRKRARPKRNTS